METNDNLIAEFAAHYINQTNRLVFLTGKAGTGKTTFLRKLIAHTHKNAIIVAPTGIAAINAGGVTIHSQFGVPFGAFVPDSSYKVEDYSVKINTPFTMVKHMHYRESKRKVLQELELLIIDEVSMLRADLLDVIDFILKTIRKNKQQAFGGVQVLFIGDLMQLPPVIKDDEWHVLKQYYKSPFFFEAQVLKQNPPIYIELEKIYRQKDTRFIDLLNHIRHNQLSKEDIDVLNTYYKSNINTDELVKTITLTTHNHKADKINSTSLQALTGKIYRYSATVNGEFNESAYPADIELELKVGAQIMFIRNDTSGNALFFNGKIAYISKLDKDEIWIDFNDGSKPFKIERYQWRNIVYQINESTKEIEEKEIGEFLQYPIKLAWAITIHKSQGLTFEKAILDINQAFTAGQIYVALSRLKSLDGLILTQPVSFNLFNQDENLVKFSDLKLSESQIEQGLERDKIQFLKLKLQHVYDFSSLSYPIQNTFNTYFLNQDSNFFNKESSIWANDFLNEFKTIYQYALSFSNQLNIIFDKQETNYLELIIQRNNSAINYFIPIFKKLSKEILSQLDKYYEEFQSDDFISEMLEAESVIFQKIIQLEKTIVLLEHIIHKKDLQESYLKKYANQSERLELIRQYQSIRFDKKKGKKASKKKVKEERKADSDITSKPEKISSKQQSYDLYKQGLSMDEIAQQRNMTIGTIEGHLSQFISSGELDVYSFVKKEKIDLIKSVALKHDGDTGLMSFIKQELGDAITYTEIKFALQELKKEL